MRALLLKSLTMLLLGCSSILFSQTRSPELVAPPVLTRVSPAGMTAAEKDTLKASQRALDKLMDVYNFEPKTPWTFEVVRCPLITKHVVMEFTSIEVSEGSSRYVAVLPQQNGRVQLIPLWYRGLRSFEKPYNDPHNIATFNETIAVEAPHLSSDTDWLQLAVCYLAMVGESPDVLLRTNIRRQLGDVSQNTVERLLPVVTPSQSSIDVHFCDAGQKRRISEWHLTFDRAGLLRAAPARDAPAHRG